MSREKRFKHEAKKAAKLEKLALAGLTTVTVGMMGVNAVSADDVANAPTSSLVDETLAAEIKDVDEPKQETPTAPATEAEPEATENPSPETLVGDNAAENQNVELVDDAGEQNNISDETASSLEDGGVTTLAASDEEEQVTQLKPEITLTNNEIVENALSISISGFYLDSDDYNQTVKGSDRQQTILPGQTLTITPKVVEGYTALDSAKRISYDEVKSGTYHGYSSSSNERHTTVFSVEFEYSKNDEGSQPAEGDYTERNFTVYYRYNHQDLALPTIHTIKKGETIELEAPKIEGYIFKEWNDLTENYTSVKNISWWNDESEIELNYELDIDENQFISAKDTEEVPNIVGDDFYVDLEKSTLSSYSSVAPEEGTIKVTFRSVLLMLRQGNRLWDY